MAWVQAYRMHLTSRSLSGRPCEISCSRLELPGLRFRAMCAFPPLAVPITDPACMHALLALA